MDNKQLNVTAYELLSRRNDEHNFPFVGEHPAFINFTYDFLTNEHKIPDLRNQIVLEIIEDVEVTDEETLIAR